MKFVNGSFWDFNLVLKIFLIKSWIEMDGECFFVIVVDRVVKLDIFGGYVFLVFLLCFFVGFIFGLLLVCCILWELEVGFMI